MLQIAAGFEGKNNWWLVISGVIYTWFGFYIFARPAGGALTLVWIIGLSNIISGILLVITAFEANSASKILTAKKAQLRHIAAQFWRLFAILTINKELINDIFEPSIF
ncbi:hypothetical protein EB118_18080 [bacterium]|nr:hypothetical protein [bacterium]NBX97989.1 hypothetical protein [bacterium]NDC94276.1 hypothetical protein [bacterium]NDD85280.1 hypothetical protein [bacterium]NDG31968.1 hypothetical protein [bacterium]